jgi:putative acetyltransferase
MGLAEHHTSPGPPQAAPARIITKTTLISVLSGLIAHPFAPEGPRPTGIITACLVRDLLHTHRESDLDHAGVCRCWRHPQYTVGRSQLEIADEDHRYGCSDMIRASRREDTAQVIDVWYRVSLIAHPFLTDDFLEGERAEIIERWLPIAETTVYEIDGRLVGFISLIDTEVGAVFVDPDYQGRGIGRALMDHARASRPFLELDVFEANRIGRGFYQAYGFRFVDRHVNDKAGQVELRLRLD